MQASSNGLSLSTVLHTKMRRVRTQCPLKLGFEIHDIGGAFFMHKFLLVPIPPEFGDYVLQVLVNLHVSVSNIWELVTQR